MAPQDPSGMALDWLLVVSCIFSVILAIMYLFYSNRMLALLVGYLLRFSWWNEGSDRAWVSLESFQVSLLAGRVMIKDLRYHSSNQSFRAIKCRITWRYWLWRTREGFHSHVGEEDSKDNPKASTLPCRLHIVLEGVEWRLFNRTAAYNNILVRLQRHSTPNGSVPTGHSSSASGQSQDFTTFASDGRDVPIWTGNGDDRRPSSTPGHTSSSRPTTFRAAFKAWFSNLKPDMHEILPIDLVAINGAIVCGNISTPSLLVAKFARARGSYSVVPSRSLHDKYKTVIDANFKTVKLDLQRNDKYRGSLVQHGMVVYRHLGTDSISDQLPFPIFSQLWNDQKREEIRNETDDMHARMEADSEQEPNDYAIVETILETPQLELSYYWDEPGIVPSGHQKGSSEGLESHDVGNGDLAPQYGIDIALQGGIARYGPWADRQRVELQRLFFPPTYQTVEPTAILKPGDTRIYTALKVFVELRDTTTFHIPFREPSKDWQFDGTKFVGSTRKRREGGWLEVRAGGDSTINYVLPWVATQDGYDALLELHLDQVNALSSVNDMQLVKADSSRVLCQLPTPRRWNDSRQWMFDVSFRMPTIHIIRDHITLLTDLGKDWNSGSPSDFNRWIPMQYVIDVTMQDFEVNLYLNDQNIITHPHARDANTLLTLRGNKLRNSVEVPSTVFRPQFTKIPFWIEVPGVRLSLTLPKWNTHSTFTSTRTTDFGSLGFVRVDCSFLYYSKTLPEYIDQLRLDITAHDVVFISFGWVARHLMSFRDNYFGNFTNFSTLAEYVTKRRNHQPVGDPVERKWRQGKSNIFEVTLSVQYEHLVIVLPAGLQGYEYSLEPSPEAEVRSDKESNNLGTCVVMLQPEFQLQLRTHDYSMEMSINLTPMILSVVEDLVHNLVAESYERLGQQKLQIDGINILANRLFGPQPRTSTYLCLWEFQFGAITGVMSTMELRGLSAALSSFRVNFIDAVNAPAANFAMPSEPDVTFLKLNLKSVDVAWVIDQTSLQLHIPQGIKVDFNDLAGSSYKKVTEVRVCHAVVRALLRSGAHRETWYEAGSVAFDVGVDIYSSPYGWREAAAAQMNHLAVQDALTRRAWFLYEDSSGHPSTRVPPAYHFSMFLPKPRFPNPSLGRDEIPQGPRVHGKLRQSHPNMESLSAVESDEDEHVSEAERDARLAHSRPATPLLFNEDYDDRSMSSSDESDNDITSGSSNSDSDEAEHDEPNLVNVRTSSPVLSHYKNIVRRFQSHLDYNTMFRAPSLFTLVRDMSLPLDDASGRAIPSAYFNVNQSHSKRSHDASLASIVRLIRSKHVEVLMTPLCMHVIKRISDEVSSSNTSLELVIDSITNHYLLDPPTETIVCASQECLDAEVSSLRLRILQTLVDVDEAITPPSAHLQSPVLPLHAPDFRIVSDIVLSLHNLTASFSDVSGHPHVMSKTSTVLRGSFSQVRAHLDMSVFHALSRMNRTLQVSRQCAFELDESKTVSTSDNFHMELGDTRLQFLGKASPEIIIATLDSVASIVREAITHAKRTKGAARQHQIWSTLQFCRSIHMDDPLAMTQPSLLVQEGRPQRMRSDATWKLFMYLRHCLRFLSASQREMLGRETLLSDTSVLPEQVDDLISILQERLAGWGFDLSREEVAMLPFVRYCFPSAHTFADRPRVPCGHLPILSFHSGTLVFSVFERAALLDNTPGNTLTFGPFHLVYRYKSQKLKLLPLKISGAAVGTFLSDLDSTSTRHHVLSAVVEDVRYTIHPSFIIFLQRLLRLHGKYASNKPTTSSPSHYEGRMPDDYWECFIAVKRISIQAAVEGMVLEVGLTDVNPIMSVLCANPLPRAQPRLRRFTSGHLILKSSQLYTRVRQADDKTEPFSSNGRDILTSLTFSSLVIDASYRMTGEQPAVIHGLLAMDTLVLSVPRSALLTYRLIEEWRTQYLPNIHVMTSELFAELEKRQKVQSSRQRIQTVKRRSFPIVAFQTSVKTVGMVLQVMHGTWFSWDVHNIVGFLRTVGAHTRSPSFAFGVQLASQTIQIGAQPGETTGQTGKCIKLLLPAFRASGNYDGFQLRSHAIIDNFSLPLKPKYMDDILVVQQNLGTHFYDVLDLIAEGHKKRSSPKKLSTLSIKYDVAFMLQGFSIGIEAPTTTLALTSKQVTGTSRNEKGSAWDFAVFDLALGLSHHSTDTRPSSGFDRSLRSAYMVLDVKASSSLLAPPDVRSSRILRLQISRMHAVMSPNSIGELGDLVDHIQAEQHLRQEQRALELQEIKNKTKRVMRAFEVQKAATSLQRSTSFLDNRTLLIDVADIGIAFPLALKNEIEVDAIGSVPAFLMSIKSATFAVKRYKSGHASMGRLSFQFVKEFDQSSPSQFDGDQHQSRNKLLYPGMKADFHSGTSTVARHWHASAYVDGFVLDLDPTIVDNVLGLVDVYHKGKERIDRLTVIPQTTKLGSDTTAAAVAASYLAVKTSNILVTLVFHTGNLHLRGIQPDIGGGDSTVLDAESDAPDVIDFPTITVWGDYRATPAASKVSSSQDQEPSVLIFGSRVHRTTNKIQPSIFRFLLGFTEKIEDRFRLSDSEVSSPTRTRSSSDYEVGSRAGKEFLAPGVFSGIQLSFSLRIDSSRMELDCAHDLGVVAALHWESGGFLMTVSPRARTAHFAGSVTGLEVDLRHLKHQGGTVQTAKADARNLAFSVSYLQTDSVEGAPSQSVSVVVDTEFGAALRFDRLQDILIFKAIYIDRLSETVPQQTAKSTSVTTKPTEGIPGLTTFVLVRARLVNLHLDLGHNVAAAEVCLESLVVRSRIAGSVTDLSVSIAHTSLNLEDERPLGGFLRLPDFSFTTARRSNVQLGTKDGISKMLDVSLSSGALDIVLQSEKRTLLQYYAKPFQIHIADDWSAIDWNLLPEERTLRLDFSVVGMEVLAIANLQSVPRIINLLSKLRNDLNVQQIDARNALATSSIAQLPKPGSALSEVADAMIRSALSKLSDGPAFSYIIVQRMKLRLENLRLALFRNPNDPEMALFQGKYVHAELERVVHSLDMPPARRLKLSFSSLYLSKYASLKYRSIGDALMAIPWLERLLHGANEWTIARVPAMNLEMNSDVRYEGRQEVLEYDLVATADERAQSSRGIYVSLNLSLYIWAGALVKGLGLEIDKALVTSGFNKPAARAVAATIASPPAQAASGAGQDEGQMETTSAPPSTSPPAPSLVSAKSPTGISLSSPATMPSHESDALLPRKYHARSETSIDYGTIEQLGEATPDAKAPWLGLKETVPPRVHEYATLPMEVLMKMLLEVYSKQLKMATRKNPKAQSMHEGVGYVGSSDQGQ